MTQIFFGTDGWRGLMSEDFTFENLSLVAQALADYLKITHSEEKLKVAVAYDGRKHSSEFAQRMAEILSGNKIIVFLSENVIPTPVLSWFTWHKACQAGVMLTASHNPPEYNGTKFKAAYGGPFLTEMTHQVEALLGKSPLRESDTFQPANMLQPYLENLKALINFELLAKNPLSIVVDNMGGAGQTLLEKILQPLGYKVTTIDGEARSDFFGRSPEPVERNLQPLLKAMGESDAAAGFATDGDADRLGAVLDGGIYLSAQELILLLADELIKRQGRRGQIIGTSSVTHKLKNHFSDSENPFCEVQVGFKYITEAMMHSPTVLGCEESGGFGYGFNIPERDGILSALLILQGMAAQAYQKLSQWLSDLRQRVGEVHYDRIDYHTDCEDRTKRLPRLFQRGVMEIAGRRIERTEAFYSSRGVVNGLKFRMNLDSAWLLLRASETEPIIRIYAEAESEQAVQELLNFGKELFDKESN
ncbi:MAG TPA: phosphoglucomutase [Candidatus Marinimicrobia bacterium]|nr:phosphoglucomutase [Candidatus Neomarinimicrobiota bacterium]